MSPIETIRKDVDSRSNKSRILHWAWKHQVGWMVLAAVVFSAVFYFRQMAGENVAEAKAPSAKQTTRVRARKESPRLEVVALVNGKDITREHLATACLQRYGEEVLESLVNKLLITKHCEKRGITIEPQEIAAEVDRMARRFQLGREQWLDLLERERGITADEYARDIVWPTLALRKLASTDIEPTPAEIQKAYEQEFGEMVRARLIAVDNKELANKLRHELVAKPDSFSRTAIEHSIDVNSASVGGLIQPIRRHVGDPGIEKAAYSLQPGEISQIIQVANQFVILKCEGRIPPRKLNPQEVREQIVDRIKDEKLRVESHKLFESLQSSATVQNVYNNPRLRETMPGVVATVNGDRITMRQLQEECIVRHGEEVIEGEISQMLLSQALQQAGLKVSQADLEAEVRHAAELAGVVDEQGKVDLESWYKAITAEQGMSRSQYLQTSVWPSAALKKLTAQDVKVTQEDMQKAFEANYGQRVRCRAIVLGTMRRAQEVWDKARRNPSVEYFGDLASEYSIEPTTKALRGEVPPLQRFGGQPQLEEAAFQLQEGQLSGIIQTGDKFIILRCEGRTNRMDIDMAEVQDILKRDIFEKKLRLAMNEKFEAIRTNSRIDNYLAGTSHAPPSSGENPVPGRSIRRDEAVRPTAGRQR